MQRKDFLRKGLFAALGAGTITPLLSACNKEDISANSSTTTSNTATGTTTSSGSCTVSPTETAGPFPTKAPSSLVTNDIAATVPVYRSPSASPSTPLRTVVLRWQAPS